MLKAVDWPGYVVGRGEDVLDSGGCGPCTAIAIVDRGFRSAVVAHITHPNMDNEVLEEMLLAARTAIPEFVDALVRVVGASPGLDEDYGAGESRKVRGLILQSLRTAGVAATNITESWNDRERMGRAIVVDLGRKQIDVETYWA
jgi:hypothetical protein